MDEETWEGTPPHQTGTIYWLSRILYDERLDDPTDVLILVALADHVDARDQCWPSQRRLAAMARCSVRTVRRHLDELEARGLIERESRPGSGGGRSTDLYRLVRPEQGPVDNGASGQDVRRGGSGAQVSGGWGAQVADEVPRERVTPARAREAVHSPGSQRQRSTVKCDACSGYGLRLNDEGAAEPCPH